MQEALGCSTLMLAQINIGAADFAMTIEKSEEGVDGFGVIFILPLPLSAHKHYALVGAA